LFGAVTACLTGWLVASGAFPAEKATPYSSIQDEKKRFGSFHIIFIKIQLVTDNSG
jgi:hypothetical protein